MQICHQRRCGKTSPVQPMAAGKASSIYVLNKRDEATFQLNGNISNHNVVRYAPRGNPPEDFFYDKPSSGEKFLVHVWIGKVKKNLIGDTFLTGTSTARPSWRCLTTWCWDNLKTSLVWTNTDPYLEPIGYRMEPQDIFWMRSMIVYRLCSLIG